jgi:hypothetical protein
MWDTMSSLATGKHSIVYDQRKLYCAARCLVTSEGVTVSVCGGWCLESVWVMNGPGMGSATEGI